MPCQNLRGLLFQAVAEDDGPQLRHRSRPETAASAAALAAGQQQPQQPADILSQVNTDQLYQLCRMHIFSKLILTIHIIGQAAIV